jgi:NADH dehydrogenase [ubiquinone] 1 alpha subcomplex assembly factor 1
MKNTGFWLLLSAFMLSSQLMAEDIERVLFLFEKAEAVEQWQCVNDGVMGGRSEGRVKISGSKHLEFFGNLSLANNGRFPSVRSSRIDLGLADGDSIVARVRGDGRKYSFNLYTPNRRTAFSYRADFQTKNDEWIEVRLPLNEFAATSFGRVLRDQKLDPTTVNGVGILLGGKKEGPFQLEIAWIKLSRPGI